MHLFLHLRWPSELFTIWQAILCFVGTIIDTSLVTEPD
jgi:hypothetical protein